VTRRTAVWIGWSILAISVIPVVAGFLVLASSNDSLDVSEEVSARLAFVPFAMVGAVIVARQPRNVIGWLCCAIGLGTSLFQFLEDYSLYALARQLPGGVVLGLLGAMPWPALLTLMGVFLPLLFPNGRLVSPRWRPLAWTAAVAGAATCVLFVLQPGPVHGVVGFPDNPIGIEEAAAIIALAVSMGFAFIGLLALLAAASLVIRFRRAAGVERQQLKWFAYAAAQLAVFFGITGVSDIGDRATGVFDFLFFLSFALVPASIGVAILRYRLYDIDRLINRTLVYGLLTALLGGVYAGSVLLLGHLVGGIGTEPPGWAVAGATLAVAALFQPARHRIQSAVDRRFNRRKYDAARTVDAFSARLRNEIDLDTLTAELLAVVNQTMEPTMASLWLRPSAPGSPGTPNSEARPTTWAY
jgi:hypothetical protein